MVNDILVLVIFSSLKRRFKEYVSVAFGLLYTSGDSHSRVTPGSSY